MGAIIRLKGLTIGNDRVDKIFEKFNDVLDVMIKPHEREDLGLGRVYISIRELVAKMQAVLRRLRDRNPFLVDECLSLQDTIDEVFIDTLNFDLNDFRFLRSECSILSCGAPHV